MRAEGRGDRVPEGGTGPISFDYERAQSGPNYTSPTRRLYPRFDNTAHAVTVAVNCNWLLIRLRLAMWAKSAGKGPSGIYKRRGLIHIAAANVDGIPEGGALRCLAKLIEITPPDEVELWQVKTALADADRLGRHECCALLPQRQCYL